MAKVSVSERNKKRTLLVSKYQKVRADLKTVIANQALTFKDKKQAVLKLNKMNRNGSSVRVAQRCSCCGRPRAVYRKFGLCRLCLRKSAMHGLLPGVLKASW